LNPFAFDGSGEALSAGACGGDITLEGEMDRVVDDDLDTSSGGLRGIEVWVVVVAECAADVCDPAENQR
jgi:hypothetical protein